MKKSNTLSVCAVVLVMIVLCGGCASVMQNFENAEIRQYTELMLDAVIADDFQAAYSLVSEICSEADFAPVFTQIQEFLGSADAYELNLLSIYTNSTISNGQKSSVTSAVYEMTTKSDRVIVSVIMDNQIGLSSFYLTPYENTDYYSTGTLQNMKGATAAQWIVLLLNAIILGFTVFAIADCCRHKIRKKALWILLLILGFVSVGATISSTGFRLSFNVGWIMAYSALIHYGSGTLMLRLMLPVGAVSYFISRHSLLNESTPTTVSGEMEPVTLAEEIYCLNESVTEKDHSSN